MNPHFKMEQTFLLSEKNRVYVFAKLLSINLDFKLSGISKLGPVDIENWFDIPIAHDEMGNIRLDLYAFALKNNADRDKLKVGEIVELSFKTMEQIKNIKPKELVPGITGYYAHGDSMTFGYVELKAGSSVPLHQHINEQITYIIEGQIDMVIGGVACSLTSGMYHVIPANTLHSAVAKTNCKVIDAFSPAREEYKT